MATPDLSKLYRQLSQSVGLLHNPYQLKVLERLQCYLDRARSPKSAALSPLSNLFRFFDKKPAGAYLYGEVGCGKTMLMDLFYDAYPMMGAQKLRVHFNQFMLHIHGRSHQLRSERGTKILQTIAEELRGQYRLLCLDEFQVVDIADAMILRGLLEALFRANITVMVTSNRPPSDLYLNGIQRASFMPCIDLIQRRLEVMEVRAQQDYRMLSIGVDGTTPYFFQDKRALERLFEERSRDIIAPCTVDVLGRSLLIERTSGSQAWIHFDELFRSTLSSADYLALGSKFNEFYICDIPQFTWEMRAEARRFVVFLDIIYDLRKYLAVHSTVPISSLFKLEGEQKETDAELLDDLQVSASASLFTGAEERFAAARAISRLRHLTSQVWWDRTLQR